MAALPQCDIAVVGGTGVYELEGLQDKKTQEVCAFGASPTLVVFVTHSLPSRSRPPSALLS